MAGVRERARLLVGAGLLFLALPAGAAAQPAWDSPLLLSPQTPDGLGVFLIDTGGGGIGVMAMYRSPIWNYGLRAGLAESGRDGGIGVFGGVDYSGRFTRATEEFPLDVDWVFGVGLSVDDNVRVSLPLGLTTGYVFRADNVTFTPYGTPRIVFDGLIGRGENSGRSSALELAVDLGLDIDIGAAFLIRFGVTLGRREAVALGLHF
jgi:hypothetical protein